MPARAKKPPTDETRALASAVLDGLLTGRRGEVEVDLKELVPLAVGEYLRLHKAARSGDGRLYQIRPNYTDREYHLVCLVCRSSLNTLAFGRQISNALDDKFREHGEICAMRLLAGQIAGVAPNKTREESPHGD